MGMVITRTYDDLGTQVSEEIWEDKRSMNTARRRARSIASRFLFNSDDVQVYTADSGNLIAVRNPDGRLIATIRLA